MNRPYVNALTVVCPYLHCHATLGEPCHMRRGSHPSRIKAAAVLMGLSDDEAEEVVRAELIVRVRSYRAVVGVSSLAVELQNPDAENCSTLQQSVVD